jgi:predicted DNA-binding ArsR family transcriptional regulator
MTTTAKLTLVQQRVLDAVSEDWCSTPKIVSIIGLESIERVRQILNMLYTRRFIDRRRVNAGSLPLEWRLEA